MSDNDKDASAGEADEGEAAEVDEGEAAEVDEKTSEADDEEKPKRFGKLYERLAEYGKIGFFVYFAIFFATWAGFAIAIRLGFEMDGAIAGAGTLGAAWVATKVTQPIRIAATFVLAPIAVKVWHHFRPPPAEDDAPKADES